MIDLSIKIHNPFSFISIPRVYLKKNLKIAPSKRFEIVFEKIIRADELIQLHFRSLFWGDNWTGIQIIFGILNMKLMIQFYDNRYWDFLNNRWKNKK